MEYLPPSPSNIFEMVNLNLKQHNSIPEIKLVTFDLVSEPGFRFAYTDEGFDSTVVGSSDGGDAGPM